MDFVGTALAKLRAAYNANTIKIVNVSGTGLRTLGAGFGAVWSPVGDQIAFNAGSSADPPQITVENADGTGHRAVPGLSALLNDWDPSGTRLLVTTGTGPSTLEVVDAATGALEDTVTTSPATAASESASWKRS